MRCPLFPAHPTDWSRINNRANEDHPRMPPIQSSVYSLRRCLIVSRTRRTCLGWGESRRSILCSKTTPGGQVLSFERYKLLPAGAGTGNSNCRKSRFLTYRIDRRATSSRSSLRYLQTTWFILQCIARGQQQLAFTASPWPLLAWIQLPMHFGGTNH